MNKNKLWKKTNWTYNDWLLKYKGKSVYDVSLPEHGLKNFKNGKRVI